MYEYCTSNENPLQDNVLCLRPLGLYSNILPQTHVGWRDTNLSLEIKSWKWPGGIGLVNISTNWSWEDTKQSRKVPCSKWWRTKWQSILICLVHSWKMSLWVSWMALWLSQWIGTAVEQSTPRSWRSQRNQRSSAVVSASAQYSVSVLERVTTDCFLLRQEMRESPRRKQYPVVERRSVGVSLKVSIIINWLINPRTFM